MACYSLWVGVYTVYLQHSLTAVILAEDNKELAQNSPDALGLNESDLMLEAFDGFLLFVTSTGRIIYASEGCELHIGIPQVGSRTPIFLYTPWKIYSYVINLKCVCRGSKFYLIYR